MKKHSFKLGFISLCLLSWLLFGFPGILNVQEAEAATYSTPVNLVNPGWQNHRKRVLFFNGSHYFLLYSKGTNTIYYQSSTDNVTWSGETSLVGSASDIFDIYLVNDTTFDLVYHDDVSSKRRVRTCTISGGTIDPGTDPTVVIDENSTMLAVARSGTGRIYLVGKEGGNLYICAASNIADGQDVTSWPKVVNDSKANPTAVAIVPYQGTDEVLVIYTRDEGGTSKDGVFSRVVTSGSGGTEVEISDFILPDFSSPISISDTDFRIIIRPPSGAMEEWRWNDTSWSQIDANIDPEGETDHSNPSLFYDRISGDMYVFSMDSNVERHRKPNGGLWQTEEDVDGDTGIGFYSYPITQMHEPPYGSSRTCSELVWAFRVTSGSEYNLKVGSEPLTPCSDTFPPDPDPMTFATPPDDASATSIDMTATTASDDTPPVEYLFTFTPCGSNGGSGGTTSSWQTETSYTDIGLEANKCYGYTVTARDSETPTPNTGTASAVSEAYTASNVPGTPTLSNATSITLDLTNDENGNPASSPTTLFAVQVVTTNPADATWLNQYVDANGDPSATAVWMSDATVDGLTLRGLQPSTTYGVKVKARNEDGDETLFSAEGQGTTTAPGPYLEQIHYRWCDDDGAEGAATWVTSEDAPLSSLTSTTPVRLRLEVSNEGPADDPGPTTYRLEYATSTSGPWKAVVDAGTATNLHWQMADSSYYSDGAASNNIDPGLTDENGSFLAGKMKDTNNLTVNLPLTTTQFTEIEYCIQANTKATPGVTYYFRLTDDGSPLHNYPVYAKVTLKGGGFWFNSNWQYRKHFRIDASRVAGNLTNFPVLISTTDEDWKEDSQPTPGHVAQLDGGDIIFTAGDGVTKLDHEIEKYDPATGELLAWVDVPSLSGSSDTGLYIYYGNTSLAEGDNQWNPTEVWDTNYAGVWHLSESSGDALDSTFYGSDGTVTGTVTQGSSGGQIDGAYDFSTDGKVGCGDQSHHEFGIDSFTVSFWLNIDQSTGAQQLVFYKGASASWDAGYNFNTTDATATDIRFSLTDDGGTQSQSPVASITQDAWIHVVGVVDRTTNRQRIYTNGTEVGSGTDITGLGTLNDSGDSIELAFSWATSWEMDGLMDEVRISNTAHSAAWIETEYNNQKAPAAFYTVGIEESPGAGADPFNNGWSYRKRMTIDAGQISADLTNFPVLVKTTDPDLTKAQGNFEDILFTAADGTMKLDHEIEKYNSSTGELVAWVEVPAVSSTSNTDIYLYYGNAAAVDQRNPTGAGVWEPNYAAVWHLYESSGTQISDSTSSDNTGTKLSATEPNPAPGQIAGAQDFDGNNDIITINNSSGTGHVLDFTAGPYTLSAWFNARDLNRHIVGKKITGSNQYQFGIGALDPPNVFFGDDDETGWGSTGLKYDGTTWYYGAVVVDASGNPELYLNGTQETWNGDPRPFTFTHWDVDVTIGMHSAAPFNGLIDEVRISKTARSAAWTQAEYNNICNPAGFLLTGIEEGPATSGDPFQNGWTYRKRLTIDASRVAADLTDFPVLINTTDADWKEDDSYSGHVAQDDGGDIIFTAGDGVTRLYHEIEKYDPSTGQLVAWVKVPSLSSSTNTNIYIYYGNTSLGVDENQWNTAGLWGAGYKGIYHFAEDPSITTDGDCAGGIYEICDATLNDNDGDMQGGMTTGDLVQAKVGDGLDFDGGDDHFYIKPTNDFDQSVITVQAWINTTSGAEKRIISNSTSGSNDWSFTMEDNGTSASVLFTNSTSADDNQMTTRTLSDGQWHHVVAISDPVAANIKIYVDGNLASTAMDPTETFGGGDVNSPLIARSLTVGTAYFLGKMDEVRVYTGALSAEWIETEYNNQQAPAAFYTVGIEETQGTGADPFNNGWAYRKRITVDSAQVPSDQTNFPVLIKTTDPDLIFGGGGHVAQDDGGDLLFTASDGTTKLDHEIEKYINSTGELVVWVEVRSLSSTSDTDIYLYYGNATAVDQWNPTGAGVWEPNYKGVWHIHDDFADSSSDYNHATNSGSSDTTGKIANGQSFDGISNYIYTTNFVTGPQELSIEAWFKTNSASGQKIFGFEGNRTGEASTNYDRHLYVGTDGKVYLGCYGGGVYTAASTNTYTDNVWHHVVGVRNDTTDMLHLYIDGKEVDAQPNPSIESTTGYWRMGSYKIAGWPAAPSDGYFPGTIDEVRLSNTARSADWVQIEYNNQSNPDGFYTIGIEEQPNTNGDPLQNGWTYRKRLTIDASRVAGGLSNFPVLISTTDADWIEDSQTTPGHVAQTDGGDILFTASDGVTKLDHEIEKYEPSTGGLVAWVEVRSLSGSTNTSFYVYYGNTSLGADENQWNPAGVWDSDYKGVWHIGEGGTGTRYDSTHYNNDLTTGGYEGDEANSSAKIDGADDFDGSDDRLYVTSDSLKISGDVTVEAWFRIPANMGTNEGMVTTANPGDAQADNVLYSLQSADADQLIYYHEYGAGNNEMVTWNYTFSQSTWYHVAVVRDVGANTVDFYVDGEFQQQYAYTTDPDGGGSSQFNIGDNSSGGTADPQWFLNATIDEVRVSSTTRSAAWVQTSSNNQRAPAAFYTVGIEETQGTGADPFNNGWTYRKKITIDAGKIPSDLTNFPVVIKTTDPDLIFGGGQVDQDDGGDLLFTASDGTTKLDHEIEKYINSTGELVVWVEVRSLSSTSDTDIYLYYGNATAVDQWNPTGAGVWEPNYAGVWHLKETVDDEQTTGTHFDSTWNYSNGSQGRNDDTPGQFANGQDFDGTSVYDYITVPYSNSLDFGSGQDFTVSVWVKTNQGVVSDVYPEIVTKEYDGTTPRQGYSILLNGAQWFPEWYFEIYVSDTQYQVLGNNNIGDGNWHYLVGTRSGSDLISYEDGNYANTTAATSASVSKSAPLRMGASCESSPGSWSIFDGSIDEVRVSKIARSADWVQAEYNNMSNPDGFYTIGIEEQDDTEGDPFQNGWTYRKRLTIDASRVAGDLTNFPVLINTTDADWIEDSQPTPGHVAQTDGGDILFTAADGITKLDHEIEKYDPTTGELVAWVEVRSLSGSTNTDIYIYYGNTSLDEAENQWNPAGAWSNGYEAVYHLHDDIADSTGNHAAGTNNGSVDTPGRAGDGQDFEEADNDYIDIGTWSVSGNQLTIQAWFKAESFANSDARLISKSINSAEQDHVFMLSLDNGVEPDQLRFRLKTGTDDATGTTTLPDAQANILLGTWHLAAATYDGSFMRLLTDGVETNSVAKTGNIRENVWNIFVGNNALVNPGPFDGIIDEVRISSVARPEEWLTTEFNNQRAPAAFYTVGIEEEKGYGSNPLDNGWSHRKKITILASEVIADLTNFPVLIKTTDPDWADTSNSGYVAQSNGGDILFTASDGITKLDHEIERYVETSGELVAWVEVRSLSSSTDTDIYIYYGNADAVNQRNPTGAGVWEPNYAAVWHLNENVADEGTTGTHSDSTWNYSHGSQSGNAYYDTDSPIAGAQDFDGTDDYIGCGNDASLDITGDVTVEAWVLLRDARAPTWGAGIAGKTDDQYMLFQDWDTDYRITFTVDTPTQVWASADGNSPDTWYHIVGVYDGSNAKIYRNGTEAANPLASGSMGSSSANVEIGREDDPFHGPIDEVRISKVARSLGYIQTTHNNQSNPSNFYVVESSSCDQSTAVFDNRKPITIHGYQVSGTSGSLTDFPLLVTIENDPELMTIENGGNIFSASGCDIIFRADDEKTHLDHEIEHYDGTTGTLVAWVRIPSLSKSADTLIYMYYGNCAITSPTENPEGVWNDYYKGVWHLKENGDGSANEYRDSTQYVNHGQGGEGNSLFVPTRVDGKIAYGQDFNDSDGKWDLIDCGDNSSLDITGNQITLQGWIRYDNASHGDMGFLNHKGWDNGYRVVMSQNSPKLKFHLPGSSYDLQSAGDVSTGTWHHVVATYDGSKMRIYVDGSQDSNDLDKLDNITAASPEKEVWIGHGDQPEDVAWSYPWEGQIDEVRISSIARSADWIKTEYNNQNSSSAFYTLGTQELSPATAVDLMSFTATGQGSAVLVAWETAQEINNMGFNLYRATELVGPFERLNNKLIPALSFSVRGESYSYVDSDVTRGKLYYYKLEDIDIYGTRTMHGPICVDWDGDGIPDDWEIAFGLDPGLGDAVIDLDGDGFSNLDEYKHGTDPLNPDTDGNGILDGGESWKVEREEISETRTLSKGVQIIASDESGLTLELRTDAFDMELIQVGETVFQRLRIVEYVHGFTTAVGEPELPMKGVLLDLPDGKTPTLKVEETEKETYSGYWIYPVPEKAVEGEGDMAYVAESFAMDEAAYAADTFYPNVTASLGTTYVFRDQQKLQVLFYPLAFNPATKELEHYRRIRVRIAYEGAQERTLSRAVAVPKPSSPGPRTVSRAVAWSPPVSQGPVYKVFVSEEGIYRMTGSWLASNNVDVSGMALDQVRLYNLGQEVAISVYDGDGDNQFDGGDYIEFYGQPVAAEYAKYARYNVYWLTTWATAGALRMAAIDGTPGSALLANTHTCTVRHELDEYYVALTPGGDSRDRWFFQIPVLGTDYPAAWGGGQWTPFNFSLSGVAGSGSLKILLTAVTDIDHEVEVMVNGAYMGIYTWSGMADYEVSIDGAGLLEGNNTVELRCNSGESDPVNPEGILVDWFEAIYPRSFVASNEMLKFSYGPGSRYRITDFTGNDLIAFDITSAGDVKRLVNFEIEDTGTYALHMEPRSGSGERTYLVLSSNALKIPVEVSEDVGSSLSDTANGADYVLIAHRDLGWDGNGDAYPWLSDLSALREGQGLRVKVVNVTDIFDEFSYGIQTPQAVKDFLTHAYNHWAKPAPQYVLVVGDGTVDPKENYKKTNPTMDESVYPYVPVYLAYTEHMGETVTDDWFARVSGDDSIPDLYIGRLPAVSVDQADTIVKKIKDYETALNIKSWEKNTLLVADDQVEDYEALFEIMNNDAGALIPAGMSTPFKEYLNDYVDAADLKVAIKNRINIDGNLIVNYSGHGSMQIWAHDIFTNADVAGLTNADKLSFFVSMTCLNGFFADPEFFAWPSLAEVLMRSADKGAVAAFMSTGMTVPEGQHILDVSLFDAVFTKDIRRLGPAISYAKQMVLANGMVFEDVSKTFLLFGDPAMALKVPLPGAPRGITARFEGGGVALTWQGATDCNGIPVSGYNVYRSTTPGGPYEKVNPDLITGTEYLDASTQSGTWYYVMTSVDGDQDESVQSSEVTVMPGSRMAGGASSGGAGGGGGGCFISSVCGDSP